MRTTLLALAVLIATAGAASAETPSLPWLARQQGANGAWRAGPQGSDAAVSALATLAFLANGHTHRYGRHKHVVRRGLRYLISQQGPDGRIGDRPREASLGALALTEAYAMTKSALLRKAAIRAIRERVAQTRSAAAWETLAGEGQRPDGAMLWTAWALRAARAGELEVPGLARAITSCRAHLASCLADTRRARPAAAGLAGIFLGELNRRDPRLRALADRLAAGYRPADALDHYAAHAFMFQMGGDHWRRWNRRTLRGLLDRQVPRGVDAGSWAPGPDPDGRVGVTALNTLVLSTYYAYARRPLR